MHERAKPGNGLSAAASALSYAYYIPRMKPATIKATTSDRLTTVLSYGALLLLGYLVFRIAEPFLVPLAWSAVLAIFFYPLHERIERRLRPTPAALMSTLGVTLLLVVPAIVVLGVYHARGAGRYGAGCRTRCSIRTEPCSACDGLDSQSSSAAMGIGGFSEPLRQGAEK